MKYLFLLFLFIASKSFGQIFSFDSLKTETTSDTTTFIYMTALWCSPCLEKMPYYDAYFQKTKKPFKLVYLFDIEKFNYKTLKNMFPHINFSKKILFIPASFYSSALIQINAHNKMFKNFIAFHKGYDPKISDLEKFSLSSFISVNSSGNASVFDASDIKGLAIKQIDSLLYAKLEKK